MSNTCQDCNLNLGLIVNGIQFVFVTDCDLCNTGTTVITGLEYVMNLPAGVDIVEVLTQDGTDITGSVLGNVIQSLTINPGECLTLNITLEITDNTLVASCPIIVTGQFESSLTCDIAENTLQQETYECYSCAELMGCGIVDTDTRLDNPVVNPDGSITFDVVDVITSTPLGTITIPPLGFTVTDGVTPFTFVIGETLFVTEGLSNELSVVTTDTVPGGTVTVDFAASPTTGGTTNQVYVFDDTTDTYSWEDINSLIPFPLPVYNNDTDAVLGGLVVGDYYELSAVNTYGLPEGLHKTVRNP